MGKFSDHLRKNIETVLKEVNYKLTYAAYQVFSQAVIHSPHEGQGPYAKGHFINNWFVGINSYDGSTTSEIDPDGKGSTARIDAMLKGSNAFFKKDGFVTLSNNLDYSIHVEVGWPRGLDPKSGWNWTGRARIYAPVQYATSWAKGNL